MCMGWWVKTSKNPPGWACCIGITVSLVLLFSELPESPCYQFQQAPPLVVVVRLLLFGCCCCCCCCLAFVLAIFLSSSIVYPKSLNKKTLVTHTHPKQPSPPSESDFLSFCDQIGGSLQRFAHQLLRASDFLLGDFYG